MIDVISPEELGWKYTTHNGMRMYYLKIFPTNHIFPTPHINIVSELSNIYRVWKLLASDVPAILACVIYSFAMHVSWIIQGFLVEFFCLKRLGRPVFFYLIYTHRQGRFK